MKKLLLAILLSLVLISCGTTEQVEQADATAPSPCTEISCPMPKLAEANDEVVDVIAQDNWQFSLTGSGWKSNEYRSNNIKIMMVNQDLKTIVFLSKEITKQFSPDYIVSVIRTFKAASAIVSSVKQITINNNSFIKIDAVGNGRHIIALVVAKNGFGYVFVCATEDEDDIATTGLCNNVNNTLFIQ